MVKSDAAVNTNATTKEATEATTPASAPVVPATTTEAKVPPTTNVVPPIKVNEVKSTELKPPETISVIKEKPHEGLKAAMLRRVKGEMAQEPMTLIDPVTGLLTPMREEEGRYIPVAGTNGNPNHPLVAVTSNVISNHNNAVISTVHTPKLEEAPVVQQSVLVKQSSKPQSLKAHVLSSQAAKAVVTQQTIPSPKPIAICQPMQPLAGTVQIAKQPPPQNINVTMPNYPMEHPGARPNVSLAMAKNVQGAKINQPQISPNQMVVLQKPPQMVAAKGPVAKPVQVLTAGLPAQISGAQLNAHVKQNIKQNAIGKLK